VHEGLRTKGRPLPCRHGPTILMSGGGTSRGCSPRSASNCHWGKGYRRPPTGVNGGEV